MIWNGPNDYDGDIAVYYVGGSGGKTYWTDRYTVHWVNDRCYFNAGHRRGCAIHKRQGTW